MITVPKGDGSFVGFLGSKELLKAGRVGKADWGDGGGMAFELGLREWMRFHVAPRGNEKSPCRKWEYQITWRQKKLSGVGVDQGERWG